MAQTFDIRFARSAGLAAFFEAPANSLRWKGTGQLIIDAQGISIAVKRGLANLFLGRGRRINAEEITGVYREGEALRLEFGADRARQVLPIWASGTEAAAEIVRLLPTSNTVETEHVASQRRFRPDWRVVAFLILLAVGAAIVPSLMNAPSPQPTSTQTSGQESFDAPGAGQSSDAVEANPQTPSKPSYSNNTPDSDSPRDLASLPGAAPELGGDIGEPTQQSLSSGTATSQVTPPAQTAPESKMSVRAAAMQMIRYFESESAQLNGNADGWWRVTVRLHTTPQYQLPELWALREQMLAVSRAWRAGDVELARRLTAQVYQLGY